LSSLDLTGAEFAVTNMTTWNVYSAYYTFSGANLSGLSSLDLTGAEFAAANISLYGTCITANYTFSSANLSAINNLYLPSLWQYTYVWSNTFSNNANSNEVNIYGYESCPPWFGRSSSDTSKSLWFPNAVWVLY
jgi:uncharacterized protein YjbI with pentapeptide repeats